MQRKEAAREGTREVENNSTYKYIYTERKKERVVEEEARKKDQEEKQETHRVSENEYDKFHL